MVRLLNNYADLAKRINIAFEHRDNLVSDPDAVAALSSDLAEGIDALNLGKIRAAIYQNDKWQAESWVKKLILLSFLTAEKQLSVGAPGQPRTFDKLPLKFESWDVNQFNTADIRVVPGAIVRHGSYVASNVVLMPCFVNIGAYIGEATMIDTWATVGSCAQIGARCHISGGVGIGGVLEPIGDTPVIIEDDVFIGARSEVAEGVIIRRGAVISMGVYLGQSTPIIDRSTGKVYYGQVPENAVVISGSWNNNAIDGLSTYAAVIVKYADEKTRGRVALNTLVREKH